MTSMSSARSPVIVLWNMCDEIVMHDHAASASSAELYVNTRLMSGGVTEVP